MPLSSCGHRDYGPRRASVYGFDADEYFHQANEAMHCFPIIESKEAIENIGDIVSTDGIEGISLGPMDLSISLGCFKQFDSPIYLKSVDKVRSACQKHKKAMGTGTYTLEHAQQCMESADTLLLAAGDDQFLATEARRCLTVLKEKRT